MEKEMEEGLGRGKILLEEMQQQKRKMADELVKNISP
jgi:hypothetical protein